jgi:thiol-disulfide isomerase/thioredoxin
VRGSAATVTYAHGRPTVVNFFAAWCDPCRRELPVLAATSREHTDVDFIGVDVADSRSNAVDLLDATHVAYAAGYDPDRQVARKYHLVGMPTTVFIKADGHVQAVVKGPVSPSALRKNLRKLVEAA